MQEVGGGGQSMLQKEREDGFQARWEGRGLRCFGWYLALL